MRNPFKILKAVKKRLDRLEEKMDRLLEMRETHPTNPYNPIQDPPVFPSVPDYLGNPNTCGKCGMTFNGATMYSCQHNDCPTGLGPITCKAPV